MNFIDPLGLNTATWGYYGTIGIGIILTAIPEPTTSAIGITILLGGALMIPGDSAVDKLPVAEMAKVSKNSKKKRATDTPSWISSYPKKPGENCGDYADRILKNKYGCDDSRADRRGPGSEYSKIKKNCERGNL